VKKPPAFVAVFAQPADPSAPKAAPQKDSRGKDKRPDEVAFGIRPFEPHLFGKPTFESVLAFALSMVQQLSPARYGDVLAREQARITAIFGGTEDASLAENDASDAAKTVKKPRTLTHTWPFCRRSLLCLRLS
jgi:hypothetical protein